MAEEGTPPTPSSKALQAKAAAAKVGDKVEVYSRAQSMWVPAVIVNTSGSILTASYTVREEFARGAATMRFPKDARAAREKLSDPQKPGAFGPQSMLDNLPKLQEGFKYWQVQKVGGMGRAGGGVHMWCNAGRTGIHFYFMDSGEHFKTYTYEDLKSWEAGPTELVLEKRQAKSGLKKGATSVGFSTKKGQAMEIVEAVMKQVNNITKAVAEAAKDLDIDRSHRSKASLNKNYDVKKAAGKGRGRAMKLQCGQMGVQVFDRGEHYKTYNYKDLDEWATVSSTGSPDESTHNRLILCKRGRGGMSTEYITAVGEATTIAHDITRKASELAKAIKAKRQEDRNAKMGIKPPAPAPAPAAASAAANTEAAAEPETAGPAAAEEEELELSTEVAAADDTSAPAVPAEEELAGGEGDGAPTTASSAEIEEYKARILELEMLNAELMEAIEAAKSCAVAPFKVGQVVEVFSRGLKAWLPGEVIEIDEGECKVSYTDGHQKGTKYVEMSDPESVRELAGTADALIQAAEVLRKETAATAEAAAEKEAADEAARMAEMRSKAEAAGATVPAVGSMAQVYSRSLARWLPGVVVAVGGDEAKVKYKTGQGQLGEKYVYWADAAEFKAMAGEVSTVSKVEIKLVKDANGYGMKVADSCHVTGCTPGSVAEVNCVPVPSRIVEVNGVAVSDKAQMIAALKAAGSVPGGVSFVFLTQRDKMVAPSGGGAVADVTTTSYQFEAEYMEEDV